MDGGRDGSSQACRRASSWWVTTPETRGVLAELGVYFGQGYLFGEPVAFDTLFQNSAPGNLPLPPVMRS
jgi:EAL domain-containing protein (putative c-di-GMP-specific phosphodiesterase class I)